MKDDALLLLLLAALAAFGGFLLSLGVDFSPRQQTEALAAYDCVAAHPEWDVAVCQGVAAGRYTAEDVLANPTWDWAAIGSERLSLGMTMAMAEAAWGMPDYVNTSGNGGYGEEWASRGSLLQFDGDQIARLSEAEVWTAEEVLTLASANASNLELRTRGRTVLIVGTISDTGSELDGAPRVEFQSASYYGAISCIFPLVRAGETGALRRGQTVVLLGIGDGMGPNGPVFRECRIFTPNG